MFEPILDPKPRGFSGRPFAALIFAVGVAVAEAYAGSYLRISDPVLTLIVLSTFAVVAGAWHWLDRKTN